MTPVHDEVMVRVSITTTQITESRLLTITSWSNQRHLCIQCHVPWVFLAKRYFFCESLIYRYNEIYLHFIMSSLNIYKAIMFQLPILNNQYLVLAWYAIIQSHFNLETCSLAWCLIYTAQFGDIILPKITICILICKPSIPVNWSLELHFWLEDCDMHTHTVWGLN